MSRVLNIPVHEEKGHPCEDYQQLQQSEEMQYEIVEFLLEFYSLFPIADTLYNSVYACVLYMCSESIWFQ